MVVDRFGNSVDPAVGYARGRILATSADEIARTMYARSLVRERVSRLGEGSVFDLTGLPRAFPLGPEDLPSLRTQAAFYAHVAGRGEDVAVRFLGGDPARHAAVIVNRVTAGLLAISMALLRRGDAVLSLVPYGRSHPSVQRCVEAAGASFRDVAGLESFQLALAELRPRMVVITPVTASKHHLPQAELDRAVDLAHRGGALVLLDDAHMAVRLAFHGDSPPLRSESVDLAIVSTDKHIAGPRAGVIAGRVELVREVAARAMEFGLEAQASHYAAALRAMELHRPEPLLEAGRLAGALHSLLEAEYGSGGFYLAGSGVAISGEDALLLAMRASGKGAPAIVPVEAATVLGNQMLKQHGVLNIISLSMPGTPAVMRLMMFPDGSRLGVPAAFEALRSGLGALAELLDSPAAARELILGPG